MRLKFVKSETTARYLETIKEYLKIHGKPESFYTYCLEVFRVNTDKEEYS